MVRRVTRAKAAQDLCYSEPECPDQGCTAEGSINTAGIPPQPHARGNTCVNQTPTQRCPERLLGSSHDGIDEMVNVEMDDKEKSKSDMDDDNYFYGNSEEDSARINAFQEVENAQISEFKRNYNRYKCKANDNSKLLK